MLTKTSTRVALSLALMCVLGGLAIPSHAHLLNMTTVDIRFTDSAIVHVELELDLSRTYGVRDAYYTASLLEYPLEDQHTREMLETLFASIELHYFDAGGKVSTETLGNYPLRLTGIQFTRGSQRLYNDALQWPMTRVQAYVEVPFKERQKAAFISAKFLSTFQFEEPIALTFRNDIESTRMSRWLVVNQRSSQFDMQQDGLEPQGLSLMEMAFYLKQGFEHILPKGYDHLLFVFALLLTARSLRELVTQLSVFTLAHSLTLLTTIFGVFTLPAGIIEPLIAASIAWVGIEVAVLKKPSLLRFPLIFVFGLVHGMGFAGVFADLGLPDNGAFWALLLFNIGIELGQLVFVIPLAFLLSWIKAKTDHYLVAKLMTAVVITLIGVAWTAMRVLP